MRKLLGLVIVAIFLAALFGPAHAASGRDYISIVGSSTVYPFATVVAEQFGKSTSYKTPKIESTGSGGGLKLFCAGVGVEHPDITNASRRIKQSEFEQCTQNGVKEIIEVKIGYDGIVFANAVSADTMKLSRADIFLALAKEVPGDADGELIDEGLVPREQMSMQAIRAYLFEHPEELERVVAPLLAQPRQRGLDARRLLVRRRPHGDPAGLALFPRSRQEHSARYRIRIAFVARLGCEHAAR